MDKEHILNEIRRTATDNDGTPLGIAKFFEATGIKQADWLGKFWARWGDAVREAGFSPNKMQEAYDDEFLLHSLAKLAQKLGHFPVSSELRLEAQSSTSFPTHNTFSRLGSKSQRLRKVMEYCERHNEFADVARICSELLVAQVEPISNEQIVTRIAQQGFVYLIKCSGFFKIGRTNAKDRRTRELAIQLPERAETVHVIATDDPIGIEAYWHKRFNDRRKNGEWFELSAEDVKAFKRRKFM